MSNYHVKKTGNDSTGDGSDGNPWLTIKASVVKLSPGDILDVHVGTYAESVTPGGFGGVGWVPGSSVSHITIRAFGHTDTTTKGVSAGTDAVVVQSPGGHGFGFNKNDFKYVDFAGFVIDGVNSSDGGGIVMNNDANNVTWRNFELKRIGDIGIEGSASNGTATTDRNNLFQYGYIHDTGNTPTAYAKHGIYWHTRGSIFEYLDIADSECGAIQFWYETASVNARNPHNNIVRYCILRENMVDHFFRQGGVFIGAFCSNIKIHNNLIYRHRDVGISFSSLTGANGNSTGHLVYNNTICDIGNGVTGEAEAGIQVTSRVYSGLEFKNNLIYDIGGTPIVDTYGSATSINNFLNTENANFNGYTQGSAWDLTLTGSTPEAILTGGADLGSEYYEDFAGNTRSGTFSIGAYANEVAIPDPPLDPMILYPTPLSVTKNINKLLTDIQAQDNNDPDVGNYTLRLVLMGNGTLNDGV